MPKLEKSKANYSYSTKYRHKGDSEDSTAENALEQPEDNIDKRLNNAGTSYYSKEQSVSPSRWYSKQILDKCYNDTISTERKGFNDSDFKVYSQFQQYNSKKLSNRGRNFILTKSNTKTNAEDRKTNDLKQKKYNSKYKCINKASTNYRYNISSERDQKVCAFHKICKLNWSLNTPLESVKNHLDW